MSNIEKLFFERCKTKSDINEHLVTLYNYALQCNHITEFGVRSGNSTVSFLNAKPKTLISYDIHQSKIISSLLSLSKEEKINFTFHKENVLNIIIEPTDLLFIDTWHIYDQLIKELILHEQKCNKYIILHDTETYGIKGEQLKSDPILNRKGLSFAIEEFLNSNCKWKIKEIFKHNNGLTILERS